MSKVLCIYHGGCDDGFAAAWVVRKALGADNVDFHSGVYQKDPPDVTAKDVVLVDFSYKRPVLDEMARKAHSILILDHHKTAQEDLSDVPVAPPWDRWRVWKDPLLDTGVGAWRRAAIFDMDRSGAAIAWDYFIGGKRPEFIEYIQDRDLWRKQLPHGDEFTIALRSYPQQFDDWTGFIEDGSQGVNRLMAEGQSIQRYYRLRVEELKRHAYPATIAQSKCWIANAPYFAASEVAGELCDKPEAEFGACYFETGPGRWTYSLRSRGDFDVSAIARKFGGGGHKNAAGFRTDYIAHVFPETGS